MDFLEKIDTTIIVNLIVTYGLKIAMALLVLAIGVYGIKLVTKGIERIMNKREVDPSLIGFLIPLISAALKIILFVSVIQMVGVQTTSFIAVLGAAGLAVGLALQGTLSNFAGGVIILLLKPFRVGDFIEAQGYTGVAHSIKLFTTVLKTVDNKTVIIPNGSLANGNIVNFTHEPKRRVDWTFSISYGNSADKAIEIIKKLIAEDPRIHSEPEPFVALHSMGDSSVNFVVRCWADTANYWGVFFDMNKKVYETFPKEGLQIPFPQMDVHLHQAKL